jgi:hypothetical protein
MQNPEPVRPTRSTVRLARRDDLDAMSRLIAGHATAATTAALAADLIETGVTFVLDFAHGGIAAIARVRLGGESARLDFLVVSPRADAAVEDRMIGIADAIAKAHGCRSLDVVAPR